MKRPFPKNSATGATEKSDQLQTTGSHEENTKMEKPDVKSWMKNYKKQRIGGKSNEETLSRSTPRRKTVYQRSKEKESHIEETHSNKVYEEMEERPKAKQTSEERRGGGESGEDLENCDIEDLESNKGHVQAAGAGENGQRRIVCQCFNQPWQVRRGVYMAWDTRHSGIHRGQLRGGLHLPHGI